MGVTGQSNIDSGDRWLGSPHGIWIGVSDLAEMHH
jgi:hypothetical protein